MNPIFDLSYILPLTNTLAVSDFQFFMIKAGFIIGDLSDVVGIYHTNPTLFYVPKQPALKQFNHEKT